MDAVIKNIQRKSFSLFTAKPDLQLTVDTFLVASRLMTGRFTGYAFSKKDEKVYIDGRFRFIFK